MRFRVPPFHPLLAAAFPIMAFYARNMSQLHTDEVVRPLVYSLLGTVVFWVLFGLVTRSVRKGAVAATAAVLIFFSYGHAWNLAPADLRAFVAPACVVLALVILVATWRTRRQFMQVTAALNVAAIVLVAPSAWAIRNRLYTTRDLEMKVDLSKLRVDRVFPPAPKDAPDIYYVILDAYARADSLKLFYGYDNSPFLDALKKRGFYIADRSRSNYDQTVLSLATSLSMNYLDSLVQQIGSDSSDPEPARQRLDDNPVAGYLRKFGYHYVAIGSGNGQVRITAADLRLQLGNDIPSAEQEFLGTTVLGTVPEVHGNDSDYDARRAYIREAFKALGQASRLPYAKFVFAHISAPHPPFLFGPNGESVHSSWPDTGQDGSWLLAHIPPQEYQRLYIGQLEYVNQQVLRAVDEILAHSKNRPIIILQGDHGSRLHLDWDSIDRTDLREPFSILNAYLVPPNVQAGLYDTITPVNTFRLILSRRFGGNYPLLPDNTYYSTVGRPYDFTDVTHRIPAM